MVVASHTCAVGAAAADRHQLGVVRHVALVLRRVEAADRRDSVVLLTRRRRWRLFSPGFLDAGPQSIRDPSSEFQTNFLPSLTHTRLMDCVSHTVLSDTLRAQKMSQQIALRQFSPLRGFELGAE